MSILTISPATPADFDGIWSIIQKVVKTGDTFAYFPHTTKEQARAIWTGDEVKTYVGRKADGKIAACYILRPNQRGLGSHVANGSFMVDPEERRQGFGRMIGEHAIEEARRMGYKAMQFNFVISTNEKAIALWKSLGFKIMGTIPQGFQHQEKGMVDIHIMHRFL